MARGRAAKGDFLESIGVKSLTRVPNIPDEYDPGEHKLLSEGDFDDTLHYIDWKIAFHNHFINELRERREKLKDLPKEARTEWMSVQDTKDKLLKQLGKLMGNDVDISQVLADIQTGLAEQSTPEEAPTS